ncbi:MAG: divergent PAP2 family protein [Dictyoglomaceae bacterium]
MIDIFEIVNHPAFLIPLLSAIIAQGIKGIIRSIQERKIVWKAFFEWGGMPSSHSALVISLSSMLGFKEGFTSSIFILSLFFAGIVIADAIGVRLATEEQAKAINKILQKYPLDEDHDIILKESIGHTPVEALSGALLGFLISLIYYIGVMRR